MNKYYVEDIIEKIGEEVELYGWVNNIRDHKKIIFVDLRDRSGLVQVIGDERFRELSPEDIVRIKGTVQKRPEKLINPRLKSGTIELKASEFEILSKSHELPVDMSKDELNVTLPTLLDYRSLTLRHPKISSIFKVQATILEGFRKAAQELGCIEIIVPTIVAGATEGGAEVFPIEYFDHKAFLSQSPQLYKQMLIPIFERVFTIAKAYRAEPSVTTRHLAEATQLDIELGFVEFEDLLDTLENVAVSMLKNTEKTCKDILKDFGVEPIAFGPIPRLTLREAQETLLKEYGRDNRSEKDLTPQDEVDLCRWVREKHKSDLVTITHFPTQAKPFYTMPDPKDPTYSLSYDLLFRGVEILSGSQRINDYAQLVESIKTRGMNPNNFEMYLQAFRYGMPAEGGFSFGLERVTMHVLGLKNIREASLFPRDMERVDTKLSKKEGRN